MMNSPPGRIASLPNVLLHRHRQHTYSIRRLPSVVQTTQLNDQIANYGTQWTEAQPLGDPSAAFDMLPVESRNADMCLIDIRISSGSNRPLHVFTIYKIRLPLVEEISRSSSSVSTVPAQRSTQWQAFLVQA